VVKTMFLIDSLMISGIKWALKTVVTAAEAEMNDDTALREQLLEAEMRREMGEISDDDFAVLEADLLARIREIKERREGSGPLAFGAQPMETSPDSRFQIEASVSGDFYDPADAPHTTIVESTPDATQRTAVIDIEPGDAAAASAPGLPLSARDAAGRRLPAEAGRSGRPAGGGPNKSARTASGTRGPVASGSSRKTAALRLPVATRSSRRSRRSAK
jgi:hypothetical protein